MVAAVDENGQLVLDKIALAAVVMAEQNAPAAAAAVAVDNNNSLISLKRSSTAWPRIMDPRCLSNVISLMLLRYRSKTVEVWWCWEADVIVRIIERARMGFTVVAEVRAILHPF